MLTRETNNSLLIIDNKNARKYAGELGLKFTGLVGIMRRALETNVINDKKEAENIFKDLQKYGFWLNKKT